MPEIGWPYSMREAVETSFGKKVPDEVFLKALQYASRKQDYLAQRKCAPNYISSNWYLIELIVDTLKGMTVTEMTIAVSRAFQDEEKKRRELLWKQSPSHTSYNNRLCLKSQGGS